MQAILFVHPHWDTGPSGGNKFNRRMLGCARRNRWPLQSVAIDPHDAAAMKQDRASAGLAARTGLQPLVLWDGLLMGRQALYGAAGCRDALLLHCLPSLNPGLNADQRAALQAREQEWISRAAFLLTTGRNLADLLRTRYPEVRTHVCEPGVDAVFLKVDRSRSRGGVGAVQLLSVGNLLPAKGYRELLAVMDSLERPNWCWHIAGSHAIDPAFTCEFLRLAAHGIAAGRIILHGPLSSPSLAALMSRMDLFVSASHYESYGMALAEAVAAGLPVVATRVGEARRVVGNAQPASLVPVGRWDAFAAAVRSSIDASIKDSGCLSIATGVPVRTWDDAFADFRSACSPPVRTAGE